MRATHLLGVLWMTCLLALSGLARAEDAAAQVAPKEQTMPAPTALPRAAAGAKSKWWDKETLAGLSALVALFGTTVPLVAKGFDSVSMGARRKKDLQRIDDLTSLMEKIKKENILTASTQADVSAQIEAEIKTSLRQLSRNREDREKAIAASQKAKEVKAARAQSELPMWRRILLLYMPRSSVAWIAHGLIVLYLPLGIASIFSWDPEMMAGSAILVAVPWLVAWFARKRWDKAQTAAPVAPPEAQPLPTVAGMS